MIRTQLFGQIARTRAIAPDDETEAPGQTHRDMAVAGHCTAAERAAFLEAGRRMVVAGG